MKAVFLKYIFVYFSVAYFLFMGTGYNVVNYCCQLCASEGIETVATSTCSTVHHQTDKKVTKQDDFVCDNLAHHPDNCHLLRVNTDIPSFQSTAHSLIKQIQIPCLFIPFTIFYDENTPSFTDNSIPPPNLNAQKSGRLILAFHAVLLI